MVRIGRLRVNPEPGMCKFGGGCERVAEHGYREDDPRFCTTHWDRLMRIKAMPNEQYRIFCTKGEQGFDD